MSGNGSTPSLEMLVSWSGPHAWPKFESVTGLPPLPRRSGVYLWTFEYRGGYLIYLAGETRQLFRDRHRQHRDEYMAGRYSIFDLVRAKNGVRFELWHGFLWKARPPERVAEWKAREVELRDTAFLARFSEPVWSGHLASWADFITTTPELEFSVHTTVRYLGIEVDEARDCRTS